MNVLYSVNLLYMGISKMYISVNIKVCWLVCLAHKNSNYVNEDGFTVLTPQLLRLLQMRKESKRNPIYGSRFYSAYEKYYKNKRNTK